MIAGLIHYNSGRAAGPFIKLNCAALPETLLEAELCRRSGTAPRTSRR